MDNAVDKKFKETLEGQKISPSPDLWAKLEAGLDEAEKSKKPKWYLFAVAALLILMIGIPSINFFLIDGGASLYQQRDGVAFSLLGDEILESGLPFELPNKQNQQVVVPSRRRFASLVTEPVLTAEKTPAIEEIIQQPKRRVIQAYARPLAMVSNSSDELLAVNNTVEEPIKEKKKWTVKRAWEKLLMVKNGDVKLPRNIHLTLPKPELFASK